MQVKVVNKKIGIIALIIIVLLCLVGVVRYFTKEDGVTTLTVTEKKWIENNKNNLIDLSIPSDVDILSNNGEGVLFDFLDDLEENTGLEFNRVSYTSSSDSDLSDYAITVTDKKEKDDILLFQDNYALITKNQIAYANTSELKSLTIGALSDDLTAIDKYLTGSTDVTYKSYKTADEMIKDLKDDNLDAIALPKLEYLTDILKEKLYFAYNITEYKKNYVIKLGDTKKLNVILTKYFKKWSRDNFTSEYNKILIQTYFDAKKIDEKKQVEFRSKRYNYGFVANAPFDITSKDGLKGINYKFLNSFAKATNIEFNYKKYSNSKALLEDFNNNNLDVIFGNNSTKYKMDVKQTPSIFDEKVAVISSNKSLTLNSINSLAGKKVVTLENSKIEKYLKDNGVTTKTYENINTLIRKVSKTDLVAIDYYTYDCFVRSELKDFKLLYEFNLDDDYNYVIRQVSANKTFSELFSFYTSYVDNKQIINKGYKEVLDYNSNNRLIKNLLIIFIAVLLILVGIVTGKVFKQRKNYNKKLSKTDKLRYVDSLTSLKNRNYLNDNVEKWDNSDVYPQSVIVIDLNNITYINDNFGHTEGDKVIVEGAGILIHNQLSNSELIRSNGNEFLIYSVGHDEKEIITYIRKLNKEFKKLSHNFGAAIGYSMITDEIKTFDDAVNEATSDMRNNK